MTDEDRTSMHDHGGDETESRLDMLIEHLVDGEGSDEHWQEFRDLARSKHEPWRRLAEQQRMHGLLADALGREVAPALDVELPVDSERTVAPIHIRRSVMHRFGPFAGWAAAVAMTAIWAGSRWLPVPAETNDQTAPPRVAVNEFPAGGSSLAMPSASLVGNSKPVLLDMSRNADGTTEVVYGRWVVERSPVGQFYGRQWDEADNPVYLPKSDVRAVPANFW